MYEWPWIDRDDPHDTQRWSERAVPIPDIAGGDSGHLAGRVFGREEADAAQFDVLTRVFSGQLGGPMAGLAPLIGELLDDVAPFGVTTGEPPRFQGMLPPIASDLTMAEAKRSRIDVLARAVSPPQLDRTGSPGLLRVDPRMRESALSIGG